MRVRPRLRYHVLPASALLPLFDGVFAVALTLLAYNLPDSLRSTQDAPRMLATVVGYGLSGVAVLLYWFKLRRLIVLAGFLRVPQLLLVFQGLLTIVLFPKLTDIVLMHGDGRGSFQAWTPAQIANTLFLGALLLVDGLCLLLALSLLKRRHLRRGRRELIRTALLAQAAGFLFLAVLGGLELLFEWFNNQYVLLVPLTLLVEELVVAWRIVDG